MNGAIFGCKIIGGILIECTAQAGCPIEQCGCCFNVNNPLCVPINRQSDQFQANFIIETNFCDAKTHNLNWYCYFFVFFKQHNRAICGKSFKIICDLSFISNLDSITYSCFPKCISCLTSLFRWRVHNVLVECLSKLLIQY